MSNAREMPLRVSNVKHAGRRLATHRQKSSVVSSQWAYWCTLATAAVSSAYLPQGSIRTIVILTPTLTALLCVSVAYWLYRDCDEYIRLQLLRCVTITAIVVMFCTLAYFFMELFGFPRVSMLWVNLVGWSVFNVQMLFVLFRAR